MRGLARIGAALVLFGAVAAARGETPRLASIFQDHMVLQREKPVPVWGWAQAGAKVTVSFAGQSKEATADAKGYWKVMLDPLTASREGRVLEMKAGAGATASCKDVLVGEVWVAAGQSNMVVPGPDIDTGVYPRYVSPGTKGPGGGKPEVRLINYGAGVSLEPQADVTAASKMDRGQWKTMAENPPEAQMNIAQYAARVIRDGIDVPVGMIEIAVPGTNQAAWMSKETLEKFPASKGKGTFYDEFFAEIEAKLAQSKGPYKSLAEFEKAPADKKTEAARSLDLMNFPTVLYNTRLHPLAPLAIRGVIWHQGEAGPGGPYAERLVAMVKQWRELFGQDFYFVFGTLGRSTAEPPPLSPVRTGFYRSNDNVQICKALDLFGPQGKATLVEFYDNGNNVTHWLEKAESGRRMGLAVLTAAYGQQHLYSGPRMTESKIQGAKATIKFTLVGDGLVYEPSINDISGVYLSGKGGTRWANVKVVAKDTIEVSHPDISEIQTVAYGDNPNPHETIFNSEGTVKLPASPFVINPMPGKDPKPTLSLVTVAGGAKSDLQVPHVRRDGYVLKVGKAETVKGFVPQEWKGVEVEAGGKPLPLKEVTEGGAKFVTFEAPAGVWVIVAEKGKAKEFRTVNRI